MMISPKEIYEKTKAMNEVLSETVICKLHKPCGFNRLCSTPQTIKVLDFDSVKELYCEGKEPSRPSVDALTYTDSALVFAEIKGWQEYFKWNIKPAKGVSRIEKGIDKKLCSYNLQGKLLESVSICEDLSGTVDLTHEMNVVFLLVTDINVEVNPLGMLMMDLIKLAETSTDWSTVCADKMYRYLNSQITDVPSKLVCCKDFDAVVNSL